MPCTICDHPARLAIDAALDAGTYQREIARTFGVARGVVQRHQRHRWTRPEAPGSPDVPSTPLARAEDPPQLTSLALRHLEPTITRILAPERLLIPTWHPPDPRPAWLVQCDRKLADARQERDTARDLSTDLARQTRTQATVDRLEARLADLTALEATLRQALVACQRLTAQWQQQEEQARRQHWQQVRAQLQVPASDPWSGYCLQLLCGDQPWAPPRAIGGSAWDYQSQCQQLQRDHPFTPPTFAPPAWWDDVVTILDRLDKESV